MFCITKNMESEEILFEVNLNGKFYKDEIYFSDEKKVIILEGVIFNLPELLKQKKVTTLLELIIALYNESETEFYINFRGNFRGCYYDKEKNKIIIFTDHCGNKPVFYYKDEEKAIFATSVKEVVDNIKAQKNIRLNMSGIYCLLTQASMYDNLTIIEGIFRLVAGHYILLDRENNSIVQYYNWGEIKKININENEAIEKIDLLFLNSVRMQAEKNKEYGFVNYAPLSAGMDSRMVSYALSRLGVKNVINFTYSQSKQADCMVPMEMASELGNVWLYKQLDNGSELVDFDESIKIADSLIYYLWPAQLNGFLKLINTSNLGVVFTGVLGDEIITSCYGSLNADKKYQIDEWSQSTLLISRLNEMIDGREKYENSEIGAIYNRGFNGVCLGYSTAFQKYTECYSPFMDVDLFSFCLSLPTDMKMGYNIYYKWANKFYPNAAKHLHNGKNVKPANLYINWHGMPIPVNGLPRRIIKKIREHLKLDIGMNPLDIWYYSNDSIRSAFNEYFENNINILDDYMELKKDVEKLIQSASVRDKTLAISLIGSLKYLCE